MIISNKKVFLLFSVSIFIFWVGFFLLQPLSMVTRGPVQNAVWHINNAVYASWIRELDESNKIQRIWIKNTLTWCEWLDSCTINKDEETKDKPDDRLELREMTQLSDCGDLSCFDLEGQGQYYLPKDSLVAVLSENIGTGYLIYRVRTAQGKEGFILHSNDTIRIKEEK